MRDTTRWIAALVAAALFIIAGCESSSNPASPPPSKAALVAPQTFTLSGVVTEASAAGVVPVSGVLIQETRSQRSVMSDTEGRYSLSGVPAGGGLVRISKDGYVASTNSFAVSADTTMNVRITRTKHYVLSGLVFEMTANGKRAVEGVQLYCDSCGSPFGHTFTSTDAGGRYQFAWSLDGQHPLQVWKDGYALAQPEGSDANAAKHVTANVHGDTQFDIEVVRR